MKFEKQLAGKDGFKRTLRDFRGRPLAVAAEDYLPPQHGQHLILTVDGNIQLITELGKSMTNMGAKKVFILNGHGGNDTPIRAALRELKTAVPATRFVFASYWSLGAQSIKAVRESELGGVGHACEMETSIMLHLHPERVKSHLAKRDGQKHKDLYRKSDMQYARPIYFVNEFHEVSETGTIGHPELATAEKGKAFLDGIVKDVLAFVDAFAQW